MIKFIVLSASLWLVAGSLSFAGAMDTNAPAATNTVTVSPAVNTNSAPVHHRPRRLTDLNGENQTLREYDRIVTDTISSRWMDIKAEGGRPYTESPGKLVVTFLIHKDGTVTDIKAAHEITETEVFKLGLCERAVRAATPFPPLPAPYDREEFTFIFYYDTTNLPPLPESN